MPLIMAFTVQDDLGTVADANAYITVDEFRTYWTDRAVDTTALTDATIEGLIVEGTQYIDTRYTYNGYKVEGRDQTTEFPRECLYDNFCNLVEGVPREVKQACCEYSYSGYTTSLSNTFSAEDLSTKKEFDKVDVLETSREYTGSKASSQTWNVYQIADNILLNSGFVYQNYMGLPRA